jgi:predicted dehydrogenase
MSTREIRIGLVGTGSWARTAHLPALLNQSNVRVVGVTDINPDMARLTSETFNIPAFNSLEEMLSGTALDALDIVTSRGMHYTPAAAGIQHHLNILCEKPLGHTLHESRLLYHAARQAGIVTQMGFTFRYSPAVQYLRDLVKQGFVGDVYHFQGFEENGQLIDPETALPRIGFSPKTDSGALHGYGSHLLDLARWILGEFSEVIGDMATYVNERPVKGENDRLKVEVDDSTNVLARFESGAQAVMQFSKVAIGNAPGVEMRIFGSRAALWLRLEDASDGYEHLWAADTKNQSFKPLPVPDSYQVGHFPELGWPRAYFTRLVSHFLERVRQDDRTPGSGDFEDGLRAQELLEAIERSHHERRWVEINEVSAVLT